uniref:GPHR_N domain-containing protein n=1 Tax=Heterorhabditis bacteriophora TaxID=37862 RepID=A0A1I7XLC8_HETBA
MSTNRKGRGSFSGIPLIGLYYFILLAIIGLSTVTTSMFVFLERDVRVKHEIPWYLRWLSFDVSLRRLGRNVSQYRRHVQDPQTVDHLLSNGHVQTGLRDKARGVALSLLSLLPRPSLDNKDQLQIHEPNQQTIPARDSLRRRLSITQYDNMVLYQYFEQVLEDMIGYITRIEKSVTSIRCLTNLNATIIGLIRIKISRKKASNFRQELVSQRPYSDMNTKWQTVIRRLEIISLVFYVSVLFVTMYLFFYHEWSVRSLYITNCHTLFT